MEASQAEKDGGENALSKGNSKQCSRPEAKQSLTYALNRKYRITWSTGRKKGMVRHEAD